MFNAYKLKAQCFTKSWVNGFVSEYVVAGSSTGLGGSKKKKILLF